VIRSTAWATGGVLSWPVVGLRLNILAKFLVNAVSLVSTDYNSIGF